MMDAAIERIAREQQGRVTREPSSLDFPRRGSSDAHLARRDAHGLSPRVPTRLRWKGLEVSEEFRKYAERIARGEELPPFEGRVLAEPNPAFPWGDAPVGEEEPKKRGSHPLVWGATIVVLGLLGWSVALKLGSDPSANLETNVAPLAPPAATTDVAPRPSATPPDVVETPSRVAPEPEVAQPSAPPAATEQPIPPAPVPAQPVPAEPIPALAATPTPAPSPVASGASVSVNLARPGALQQAVGAALAGHSATPSTAAATAPSKAVRDDEFGIMASVSSAPGSPAPSNPAPSSPAPSTGAPVAATPTAPAQAPAGAKSNGNVGDLARVGQPPASGVRKEPGSESSAKGSLLVETPSF
jgi:hypothetical protein